VRLLTLLHAVAGLFEAFALRDDFSRRVITSSRLATLLAKFRMSAVESVPGDSNQNFLKRQLG
jgi:hypothetical protein